ncbi:MAG: 8-oxo-dGTP diphosphatase [Firmicutes bacterium]|nr:8-oxo-dGTP diphosphatase [Bacillota bacterium]
MLNPIQLDDLQSALASHGLRLPADHAAVSPLHRPAALCYIYKDGQVLLLRRLQPPFAGYWTAPGGKVRPGETPDEAVRREVREETGLTIAMPRLRLVVLESGPRPLLNWLLYVYLADAFSGEIRVSDEGPLAWTPVERLPDVGMPEVDRIISQHALSDREPLWIEVTLDTSERSVDLRAAPLRSL